VEKNDTEHFPDEKRLYFVTLTQFTIGFVIESYGGVSDLDEVWFCVPKLFKTQNT